MANYTTTQQEREMAQQCLVAVINPITGIPIFIDLVDNPPRTGAIKIIRTAENGIARPWSRRMKHLLVSGWLPHFVVLAEEANSLSINKWMLYKQELSLRLLEDPVLERPADLPETAVFSPKEGFQTIVDAIDLDEISRHHWRQQNPDCDTSVILHVCEEKGYRCGCEASSLHRFIARADKDQIVWHRSGRDDNTRRNLICCSLKPSQKRQEELRQTIQAMITERAHRRGRPKKQHSWR